MPHKLACGKPDSPIGTLMTSRFAYEALPFTDGCDLVKVKEHALAAIGVAH